MLHKAQEGVKGGTLAGGSPFAGGPRRPQPVRATVGLAVDEGKGRRGRRPLRVPAGRAVCRGIYCEIIPRPGGGRRNAVGPAVTVTAGRRGRRPLRAGMSCTVLVYGIAKGRGPIPARTSVYHTPHIEIKNAPPGRFHHSCGAERPNCNRPRSGHLSGRVAPPTRVGEAGGSRNLTGAPPPQALFFGAPPRFFGQDQRNGVDKQHNLKSSRTNRRVPPTHPRAGMEPRPYGTGRAPRFATKKRAPCGARLVAGRGFEPTDLRVMSPTSYRTAPPRDIESLIIIARSRLSVNTFFIAGSAGGPPCPGTCRRRW